jgi:hypothetical protein
MPAHRLRSFGQRHQLAIRGANKFFDDSAVQNALALKAYIYGFHQRTSFAPPPQAAVLSFSNAGLFRRLRSRSPDAAC